MKLHMYTFCGMDCYSNFKGGYMTMAHFNHGTFLPKEGATCASGIGWDWLP